MALSITFYDHIKYGRLDFIDRDADFIGNGVVALTDFPLVFPATPNLTVQVGAGRAWVDGYRIANDSTPVALTFQQGDPNYPRIDIIQIGHDDINSQASLVVKQGVPGSQPVEPGPDPGYIALYAVTVPAGATQITSANVADRRSLVPLQVSAAQINYAGAVANQGGLTSMQAGLDASKPAPGNAGRLYVATDTQIVYLDTGTAWEKIGVANWGDVLGKPSAFPPTAHKSTHAIGGSDQLTPADIGAIPTSSIGAPGGVAELDGSGLIPLARIPSSLARADQANTFAGEQTFSGLIVPNGMIAGALGTNGINGNPIGWNLIPNSSFRLGNAFWTGIDQNGFTVITGTYGEGGILKNSSGTTSEQYVESISIPITGNAPLTLSADIHTKGNSSSATSGVDILFYDNSGNFISSGRITANNGKDYTRYSLTVISPSNAASMKVRCWQNGLTSNTNWRRIKLEVGSVATPYTAEADLWPMLTHGVGGPPVIATNKTVGIRVEYGVVLLNTATSGGPGYHYQATVTFQTQFNSPPIVVLGLSNIGSQAPFGLLWTNSGSLGVTGFTAEVWSNWQFTNAYLNWLAMGK